MRPITHNRQSGMTLLEMTIAVSLLASLMIVLGYAITTQASLLAQGTDVHRTFMPAQQCLQRIQDELKAAVNQSPGYVCSQTSITFRPVVGAILTTDGSYDSKKSAGFISAGNIEYASYTKRIQYDAVGRRVTLTLSGSGIPAGMRLSETLLDSCEVFEILDGDRTAQPIPAATTTSVVLLFRLESLMPSVITSNKGSLVSSSFGGVRLSQKVRVPQELLLNSQRGAITGI